MLKNQYLTKQVCVRIISTDFVMYIGENPQFLRLQVDKTVKKKPQLIANLLGSRNTKTKSILLEAKFISQINLIVNQLLDHQLGEHVYASSIDKGQLTLIVDSPVWATRLRYLHSEIINGLSKFTISKNINRIDVKVRPMEFRPKPKKITKRKMSISLESASQMQQEIDAISDSSLKDSLRRILRHAK